MILVVQAVPSRHCVHCAHDSCAAPIVSGIKKFRGEFEAYLAGKRQPVMVG